jgi:predicted nucleic acid-binding protein
MFSYLLDTNILLRLVDRASIHNAVAVAAVSRLLAAGHDIYVTAQVLIEFWSVATRPLVVNGLGWQVARARDEVDEILNRFPLLEDSPDVFPNWLRLVEDTGTSGRQVHDARLVSVMQAHGITHLLTLNVEDFRRYTMITVMHPGDVR